MTIWDIEITKTKGEPFPWKAAVVAKNGKRLEVGEFLHEKEARSYASMELHRLASRESPDTVATPRPQAA